MKFKKFLMFVFVPLFVLSLAVGGINISFGLKSKNEESSSTVAVDQIFDKLDDYVVVSDGVVYEKTTTMSGVSLAAAENNNLTFDDNGKLNIVFVKGGDQTGTVAARLTADSVNTNQIASIISAEKTDDGIIIHTYDYKNNAIIEHSYDADYTLNQMVTNTEDKLSFSNGAFEILSSSGVISLTAATTAQTAQVAHINAGTFTFSNGTYGVAKPASGTNTTQTTGRAFYVTGGSLTLNSVTIQNFYFISSNGGGICCVNDSNITLNLINSVIKDCSASNGGAVFVGNSTTFNFTSGTIGDNVASAATSSSYSNYAGQGGAVYVAGTFNMNGGLIGRNTNNSSYSSGGVHVATTGTFNLNSGTIQYNSTHGNHGGGIHNQGTTNIHGGLITRNVVYNSDETSYGNGGGVYGHDGIITMDGGVISYNIGGAGGGIHTWKAPTTITGGSIINNQGASGGAFYSNGATCSLTNCLIQSNTASSNGGGIFASGTINITDCTIINNTATGNGGGVYVNTGRTVTMNLSASGKTCVLYSNSAVNGGGIYNAGTCTMYGGVGIGVDSGNLMAGNSATNGAGLYNTGTFTTLANTNTQITAKCDFLQNSASNNGGSIYNTGNLILKNFHAYESSATNNGGAIYSASGTANFVTGLIECSNCNTSTGNGGGVYVAGGTFNAGVYSTAGGTSPGVTIENCQANMGGGVYLAAGSFNTDNSYIRYNSATTYGGGIYVGGGTLLTDSNDVDISHNTAKYGGAVSCNEAAATINLVNGDFSYNEAELGGACYFHYTQPGASSVTQYLNVYIDDDGNDGDLVRMYNNTATKPSSGDKDNGKGGAIYMNGRATRVYIGDTGNSEPQFYDNTADVSGGVIYTTNKAILVLDDGNFYGNHTVSGSGGGSVICNLSDYTTINGGNIGYNYDSKTTNTSVWWNGRRYNNVTTYSNNDGMIYSHGYSLTINNIDTSYSASNCFDTAKLIYYNTNTWNDKTIYIDGGSLIFNSGELNNVYANCSDIYFDGGNISRLYVDFGTSVTIDDINLSYSFQVGDDNGGDITINGGDFSCNGWFDIHSGDIIITGGAFNCNVNINESVNSCSISGGDFYNELHLEQNESSFRTCNISGNTYIERLWVESDYTTNTLVVNLNSTNEVCNLQHEGGSIIANPGQNNSLQITHYYATDYAQGTFTNCFFEWTMSIDVDDSTAGLTFTNCDMEGDNNYDDFIITQNTTCPITFTNCTFGSDITTHATASTANLTFTGCTFSGLTASANDQASAIFVEPNYYGRWTPNYSGNHYLYDVTITNCTFENLETENSKGGSIRANWCNLEIDGCTFNSCINTYASGNGGAIYVEEYCDANIYHTSFTNCSAQNGGAIYIDAWDGSSVELTNCSFTNCYAAANGGAIYSKYGSDGLDEIEGCTFTGCHSNGYGGAIYTDTDRSDVDIYDYTSGGTTTHTTFTNCYTSDEYGTAIYANRGCIYLTNVVCTYSSNSISEPMIYLGSNCDDVYIDGGTYNNANGDCIYDAVPGSDMKFTGATPAFTAPNGSGVALSASSYIGVDTTLTSGISVWKDYISTYDNEDSDNDNYTIAYDLASDTFSSANAGRFFLINSGSYALVVRDNRLVVNSIYTITYNKNDGSGTTSTQNVIQGESFTTKPANTFSRTGYTFTGWGGSYPNASTAYTYSGTSDITLYAQWRANTYTISYTMNSGTHSGTWDTSYTFSESSQTKSIGSASRTGYNGSVSTNKGTISGSTLTIPANATGNITVTWTWTLQTFTVTFARNDSSYGSLTRTSQTSVPYGSTISVSGNKVTINGTTTTATAASSSAQYSYAFSSWSGTSGTITGNRTITANFTRSTRTYTVTLNVNSTSYGHFTNYSNGGERGTTVTISGVQYGKALSISGKNIWSFGTGDDINATAYSGYQFSDFRVNGSTISSGYQVTGNVTITAYFASSGKTITVYITAHNGVVKLNNYNGTTLIDYSGYSTRSYTITIGGSDNLYLNFDAPGQDGDYDSYETRVKAGTSNGSSNLGSDTGGYDYDGEASFIINASSLYNGMTIYITDEDA